jgi:tRNA (guanine37-N1)-methyltransferase
MLINVVALFPDMLKPALELSIVGRAVAAGLVEFRFVQLRDFAHDRHQTVDDYAYGDSKKALLISL